MSTTDFDTDIEELVGDDILELTIDDIQAVIGLVEEEGGPIPVDTYKAVVLDFITKVTDLGNEEEEEEEE